MPDTTIGTSYWARTYHEEEGKMYWFKWEDPDFYLMRSNPDGSEEEELLLFDGQHFAAGSMALDKVGRKLYWGLWVPRTLFQRSHYLIQSINLDGSGVRTLSDPISSVEGIALAIP